MSFSRRNFLKGAGMAGASLAASHLPFGEGVAHAQGTKKKFVVLVFTLGGFNSIFSSADSYMNQSFGVNNGNVLNLGSGLVIDSTWAALPQFIRTRTAAVGVRHLTTDHGTGQSLFWMGGDATQSAILRLASAMGGDAPIKAAALGTMPQGTHNAIGGVSLQRITDMQATIAALQGGQAIEPARALAAKGATAAEIMSKERNARNAANLRSDVEGRAALVKTLTAPVNPVNYAAIPTAYNSGTGVNNQNFASMFAAAELMIRAGTNVVTIMDNFAWDTHGDTQATNVRNMMGQRIIPPLTTFINRMFVDPATAAQYEGTVIFGGDFARSLPGSDHANCLSALAFGNQVKLGTTGKMNGQVALPQGTPSTQGMWAYLAAMAKVTNNPFGNNPHGAITL